MKLNPQCVISFSKLLVLIVLLVLISSSLASANCHRNFLLCLSSNSTSNFYQLVYTQNDSLYSYILQSSVRNLRFNTTTTPKPLLIVTPSQVSQVQRVIGCAFKTSTQIRIRSGGHDYEGLSYVSPLPFVVLDLTNLSAITVDASSNTAWVQAGATLGQLYYRIAEKSGTLAFPAGICKEVGIGGHFSGGGYGPLMRKYGLAADNIIDAHVIDVNGRVLDRASMGEDFFWAIRGGGGNTFGVVIAWKVKLVTVPSTVTVFTVRKTLEQNATKLVHRWQSVADKLDKDLFIRLIISRVGSQDGNTVIQAGFNSLFLGGADKLIGLMQNSFPELGLVKEDCREMSWIESTLYFDNHPDGTPLEVLLNRTPARVPYFKAKTDYVSKPIPETGLEGLWKMFYEIDVASAILILNPYGGRMSEISESSIPFPHRAGNLYKIQHYVNWGQIEASERHINWTRSLYNHFAPYVSKNPRAAYVNYRDLDMGINNLYGKTSYKRARRWGIKYFKSNFDRLVRVKTMVDPTNFFRNEQSIPPLSH